MRGSWTCAPLWPICLLYGHCLLLGQISIWRLVQAGLHCTSRAWLPMVMRQWRYCLRRGARTNAPASTRSSTVLGTALLNGTLATVELLLRCGGVEPNQPVELKDCSTSHLLLLACEQRPEAVPLLLAAGAYPSLGHGCLSGLGVGDWYEAASPLMAAATVGSEEAVVALLEAGQTPWWSGTARWQSFKSAWPRRPCLTIATQRWKHVHARQSSKTSCRPRGFARCCLMQ